MPPFLAAILAAIAGNVGTDVARRGLDVAMGRVPATLGGPRRPTPPPSQVAPPRAVITPPVGWGPPVGRSTEQPLSGPELAARLRSWRP